MTLPQPANVGVEQTLIGSVIVYPDAMRLADGTVTADDFYEPVHQEIWRTLSEASATGRKIDLKLLINALGSTAEVNLLKGTGSMTVAQYLARLAAEAVSTLLIGDYAQAVRDLADQRRIADVGASLRRENPEDPDRLAVDGIDALDQIIAARSKHSASRVTMAQALTGAVEATAKAYQANGAIIGVPWCLDELDHKTLGLQPEELTILAARPSMGKSSIAVSCSRQAAKRGHKVLLVSLEMSAVPLGHRLISDELFDRGTALSYHRMRGGHVSQDEFGRMTAAATEIETLPLTINDGGGLTFPRIAAQARQMKRRGGLDLLVVDHLQLIQPSSWYGGQRVHEVSESTAAAKVLAKELRIPVLMLCQLSRAVEGRTDKRPQLSDLRDSGSIEQDADVVVMAYRESYYLQQSEPTPGTPEHFEWQTKMEAAHNKCELIVAKQRNGPTGSVQIFLSVADNAVRNAADASRLPERI